MQRQCHKGVGLPGKKQNPYRDNLFKLCHSLTENVIFHSFVHLTPNPKITQPLRRWSCGINQVFFRRCPLKTVLGACGVNRRKTSSYMWKACLFIWRASKNLRHWGISKPSQAKLLTQFLATDAGAMDGQKTKKRWCSSSFWHTALPLARTTRTYCCYL